MNKKQRHEAAREEARAWFQKHCPPGTEVFCILDHVSRSGMLRRIRVLVPYINDDGSPGFFHPNHAAGVLTGYKQAPCGSGKGDGLAVGGCGMDMGFALVSDLSSHVYPDGFGCIGERCPSNDHSNGDRDYTPHAEAEARDCAACAGKGKTTRRFMRSDETTEETCRTCQGDGRLEAGHWHRSGAYALRHRWL